jgi:CRP-like cAMP-binding protein
MCLDVHMGMYGNASIATWRSGMNARESPIRGRRISSKNLPSAVSTRSAQLAEAGIGVRSRLQTTTPQPTNGDTVFDAQTFLARSGLGKSLLSLKKNEAAFSQGDPADAIFYVQKGRLCLPFQNHNVAEDYPLQ